MAISLGSRSSRTTSRAVSRFLNDGMPSPFILYPLSFILLSLPLVSSSALAQVHDHAAMGDGAASDSLTWRMPPMDMSMPMMPGMDNMVPTSAPYLPLNEREATLLPDVKPSELVTMADGDTLLLRATMVRQRFGNRYFAMFGYNGQIPGPLIRAPQGSRVVIRFENHIDQPTTVHWHGLRLDNPFDGIAGVTQDPVEPHSSFVYELKFPDEGLYWYHPHIREDIQQDLGLYGNLVVEPSRTDALAPVNREEVLVLDDLLVDAAGLIPYGADAPTHALMGRFGNVMLVNGVPDYRLSVDEGEVVRFFLTNVANARTFNVTFGSAKAKVVASDVSRFEREVLVESVPIAPAERYVVDVLFGEAGEVAIANTIQAINHFRGEFYPHVDTLVMVSVGTQPADQDLSAGFHELRDHEDVTRDIDRFRAEFDGPPDHELELTLTHQNLPLMTIAMMQMDTLYVPPMEWNDAMPMMNWASTGNEVRWVLRDTRTGKENMDIEWSFRVGDVSKIRIFNAPKSFHPMNHPIHIHGQRYLVLSMDGVQNRNQVWKDTAIVPVGSTMDILVDMSNPGTWMLHCHISEHLQSGMMLTFTVAE